MTNYEKYKDELLWIVCAGGNIAYDKKARKPRLCKETHCDRCLFDGDCIKNRVKWLNAEYTGSSVAEVHDD